MQSKLFMLSSLVKGWRLVLGRVHLVLALKRAAVSGTPWEYLSQAGHCSLQHEPASIVHQSQGMEVINILDGPL